MIHRRSFLKVLLGLPFARFFKPKKAQNLYRDAPCAGHFWCTSVDPAQVAEMGEPVGLLASDIVPDAVYGWCDGRVRFVIDPSQEPVDPAVLVKMIEEAHA